MLASPKICRKVLAALAVLFVGIHPVSANWFTIKNESGHTIIVQECTIVNGQVKRGNAKNLLAGETLREFVPGPTTKRIEVFEAKNPGQASWSGSLSCRDENPTFAVTGSGGKIVVGVATPTHRK